MILFLSFRLAIKHHPFIHSEIANCHESLVCAITLVVGGGGGGNFHDMDIIEFFRSTFLRNDLTYFGEILQK